VGRALVSLGILLVVIGLAIEYSPRLPFRIGRLPGDIYIHRNNTTFYFPVVTCILVSAVLTLLMWFFNRR
jgi:ribose/xylose/arabinose/galactoside ABC-type transport system permease subunit